MSGRSRDIPDEGVDLDGVDVVELLQSLLDLGLVGLDVDDEDEGVVLLNLLHGALRVERVQDDLVLIEARLVRDRLAGVFGSPGHLQGLGAVEGGRVPDLGLLLGVSLERVVLVGERFRVWSEHRRENTHTLEGSLSGSVGLLGALGSLGGTA